MKKLLLSTLLLTALALYSTRLSSQITIGSGQAPVAGALLDLKQKADGTSTMGLGLPRVKLTSTDNITNGDIAGVTAANKDAHIGLLVYNISGVTPKVCAPVMDGIYVWNGTKWQGIGMPEPPVFYVTDLRDNEVYLARNFGSIAGDWMLEPMRYVPKASDGFTHTAISPPAPPAISAKRYIYAEGDAMPYDESQYPSAEWPLKKKNGLLYNWAAATNGQNASTSDQGQGEATEGPAIPIQGICPSGWHLPSDREWNDLEREIYNNAHLYSSYTEAEKNAWTPWLTAWETAFSWRPAFPIVHAQGIAMTSPCPIIGSASALDGKSLSATQGGFNAQLVGTGQSGYTAHYGNYNYIWTSSSFNDNLNARIRYIENLYAGVGRGSTARSSLLSVRCKRN